MRALRTKCCRTCGDAKLLRHFYRHPSYADGHESQCKVCKRRDVAENYALKREQYVARHRAYNQSERGKAVRRRYLENGGLRKYNEARRMNYRARVLDGLPGRGRLPEGVL